MTGRSALVADEQRAARGTLAEPGDGGRWVYAARDSCAAAVVILACVYAAVNIAAKTDRPIRLRARSVLSMVVTSVVSS